MCMIEEATEIYRPLLGYKFRPTDKQLLGNFLYTKVTRMALPPEYDTVIRDCDLYGELEPWQIWELYKRENEDEDEDEEEDKEKDLFFFTQLKKKSANGSRINRKVGLGNGAWQGEDAGKKVTFGGRTLGFKKRFRYENKGCEHDGGWIMHEYSLDSSLLESHPVNDYVLCRIRRNVNVGKTGLRSKKRRKQDHEEEKVHVDRQQAAFDYDDHSESWSLAHKTGLRSKKRRKQDHEAEKVNVDLDQQQAAFDYDDHSESWSLTHMTSNFWNVDYNTSFD